MKFLNEKDKVTFQAVPFSPGGLANSLPLPEVKRKGWPWTKESKPLPPFMPNGKPWPKISIVTPSFNQGKYLEETIRSVLLQNYPNLEYIIMDGGSTDNSVEIIKKYEPWLTYWVSEKDNGQADAIYRGFEKTTGEIIAWINSDDYYLPDAFKIAVTFLSKNKKKSLLIGSSYHCDTNGNFLRKYYGFPQYFESIFASGMHFSQPACFWLRETFFHTGGFDKTLRFCFDYDLFLRLARLQIPAYTRKFVAVFREHKDSKTALIPEVRDIEKELVQKSLGILIDNEQLTQLEKKSHTYIKLFARSGKYLRLFGDARWLADVIYKIRS